MMTYRTYRTWPFSVRCAPNLSSQPRGFTQERYQRPPATPGLRARVGQAHGFESAPNPVISRGPQRRRRGLTFAPKWRERVVTDGRTRSPSARWSKPRPDLAGSGRRRGRLHRDGARRRPASCRRRVPGDRGPRAEVIPAAYTGVVRLAGDEALQGHRMDRSRPRPPPGEEPAAEKDRDEHHVDGHNPSAARLKDRRG